MNSWRKSIFLFETIKILDFVPQNLEFHKRRIAYSLGDIKAKFNLEKLLNSPLDGVVRAKVIYDMSGNLKEAYYFPYKFREFNEFKLTPINFGYSKKFLDRSQIDGAKGKFDEIIMIKDKFITDTSIANLAIFDDGWVTPKTPLLNGTTRARLLEDGFLREGDIDMKRLASAKRFALMNAMIGFCELKEFKFIS
ncbi:aminotransferase class IV [Campylobacter sp.]|uniref:aminotransferase class IV n=1 Tax=Campylobacter sp. TaxID=205 RepID=UPI002708C44B|nr:aminotransferase class IV [Campylobacter sp.]